jgi:probable F420-dependent oxidoreductase
VKLGYFGINMGLHSRPDDLADTARLAESAGLESLWTGEHVVLPSPQLPTGQPMPPDYPYLDSLLALSWAAAQTTRLLLGTGIVVLPHHNPVVFAKQAATLDVLSKGRLRLGIGAGYQEREFAAVGVAHGDRGPLTDEYLDALERLWYDAAPEHHGRFVDFAGVDAYPRPVQQPIPIIVGGHAKASLRRAVTRGHGWYGFMTTPESTARCLDALHAAAARFERPAALDALEITVTPYGPLTRDAASAYRDLGVDRVVPWHIDWTRFPGDAVPPNDWRGVEAAIEDDLRALG